MVQFENYFKDGIVNAGNVSRLKKVFEKLRNKEKVTVVGLGGSITEGAWSSKPEYKYFSRFCTFLKDYFNTDLIEDYDVGIGSTTSLFGYFRLQKDVLNYKPDLVTVDFSVNDDMEDNTMKYVYESLIKRILSEPNAPAVIMMHFTKKDGSNCQQIHSPVAKFYNIPALSYRDAYYPLVENGTIKWEYISPDSIHPNDVGHKAAATLLSEFVKAVDNNELGDSSDYVLREDYLYGPIYANPRLIEAKDIKVEERGSFEVEMSPHHRHLLALSAKAPNKPLIFKVEGTSIGFSYLKWASGEFGTAKITIDDNEHIIEGHFNAAWEGYLDTIILESNLVKREHTVKIELLDEKPEGSTGEKFMICYLLLAD